MAYTLTEKEMETLASAVFEVSDPRALDWGVSKAVPYVRPHASAPYYKRDFPFWMAQKIQTELPEFNASLLRAGRRLQAAKAAGVVQELDDKIAETSVRIDALSRPMTGAKAAAKRKAKDELTGATRHLEVLKKRKTESEEAAAEIKAAAQAPRANP